MPRRVQDIVPGDRRSIRNIPVERPPEPRMPIPPPPKTARRARTTRGDVKIPIHKKKEAVVEEAAAESTDQVNLRKLINPPIAPQRPRRRGWGGWFLALIFVLIIVGGAGFIASEYFSRATFTIIPKSVPLSINSTYVAQFLPNNKDPIPYEVVVLRGTASTTVPAVEGQAVSTRAEGRITIYNNYSAASQQLVAGTRLAENSGRVYRLKSSIVVPGKSGNTAGKIVTEITADQPGQSYNMDTTEARGDFKIIAYRGNPKYDGFYGRLATDLTGGFAGKRKAVSPAVLASTTENLRAALITTLKQQLKDSLPPGQITYDPLYTATFSSPDIGGNETNTAIVSLSSTFNGIVFKRSELALRLAGPQSIEGFGEFTYETPGLESLQMSIANAKDFSAEKRNTLMLHSTGEFSVVGVIPTDEIKERLAGMPLSSTQEILKAYGPVIKSAQGELIPPWAKVPADPKRISVVVKED